MEEEQGAGEEEAKEACKEEYAIYIISFHALQRISISTRNDRHVFVTICGFAKSNIGKQNNIICDLIL